MFGLVLIWYACGYVISYTHIFIQRLATEYHPFLSALDDEIPCEKLPEVTDKMVDLSSFNSTRVTNIQLSNKNLQSKRELAKKWTA